MTVSPEGIPEYSIRVEAVDGRPASPSMQQIGAVTGLRVMAILTSLVVNFMFPSVSA